jgi:hypothetical protein
MINLLPYDLKKKTIAARVNAILFRCVTILTFAIGFVALTSSGAYLFLGTTKANNQERLTHLAANKSASTPQGQVQAFRSDLTTASAVLSQQVSYTDIITGLGALLPKGTVIDSLTLSDSTLGVPMNLKIRAISSDLETTVKSAFANSAIFTGYKLISNSPEAGLPGYPAAINISIVVNRTQTR